MFRVPHDFGPLTVKPCQQSRCPGGSKAGGGLFFEGPEFLNGTLLVEPKKNGDLKNLGYQENQLDYGYGMINSNLMRYSIVKRLGLCHCHFVWQLVYSALVVGDKSMPGTKEWVKLLCLRAHCFRSWCFGGQWHFRVFELAKSSKIPSHQLITQSQQNHGSATFCPRTPGTLCWKPKSRLIEWSWPTDIYLT